MDSDLDDLVRNAPTRSMSAIPEENHHEDTLSVKPPAAAAPSSASTATDSAPLPYRLRMADGVIVNLDLTVYLGRDPSVPRIASDRRVRLVAVPSFDKQVSATHIEIRTAGDTVVATDMLSTNGSIVTVPGSASRTLLRGESAVVTPGTLIDLGDGNVLELLGADLGRAVVE